MPDPGVDPLIRSLIEAAIEWRYATAVENDSAENKLIEAIDKLIEADDA